MEKTIDKQKLLAVLETLVVNEYKRPGTNGLINPSNERCEAITEAALVLDAIFGLGGQQVDPGAVVMGRRLWISPDNRKLIEEARSKKDA